MLSNSFSSKPSTVKRSDSMSRNITALRYMHTCHILLVVVYEGGSSAKNDRMYMLALMASIETKCAPRDN
jgi:hypothetical protein